MQILAFTMSTFGILFQTQYPLTSLTLGLNIYLNILYRNIILNIGREREYKRIRYVCMRVYVSVLCNVLRQ